MAYKEKIKSLPTSMKSFYNKSSCLFFLSSHFLSPAFPSFSFSPVLYSWGIGEMTFLCVFHPGPNCKENAQKDREVSKSMKFHNWLQPYICQQRWQQGMVSKQANVFIRGPLLVFIPIWKAWNSTIGCSPTYASRYDSKEWWQSKLTHSSDTSSEVFIQKLQPSIMFPLKECHGSLIFFIAVSKLRPQANQQMRNGPGIGWRFSQTDGGNISRMWGFKVCWLTVHYFHGILLTLIKIFNTIPGLLTSNMEFKKQSITHGKLSGQMGL